MNKNIAQTIRSFAKSLLLSLILHLACGVTSYALWYALQATSLTYSKLKKGEFLTTSIEFVAFSPSQSDPISANTRESTIALQKARLSSLEKTKNKNIMTHSQQHVGSTLSDIIPNPENKHPTYPEEARLVGREALCIMKISIAPNGTIHKVDLENGTKDCPSMFMHEAKKAISTWRFSPHRSGYAERTIPIKFSLN